MRRRQRQGTGTARQRGNRWEIRIFVDGRRLSVYGATQEEAQRKADAAKQQRRRTGQAPTVRDWLAEWLELRRDQVRPQTWLSYEAHARLHIVPSIGPVRLDVLTPEHLDRLHAELARKVGGTTAHHVHMTLATALNVATKRGLPVSSAIHAVSPPRRAERAIVTLSPDEVDRLLAAAAGDPREALYVVAVLLGVREGELLGLPWGNVDRARRQLGITGTASRTLEGEHVVTLPKTSASRRRLMLPLLAVDALARTPRLGDLVWPGDDGRIMPSSTLPPLGGAPKPRRDPAGELPRPPPHRRHPGARGRPARPRGRGHARPCLSGNHPPHLRPCDPGQHRGAGGLDRRPARSATPRPPRGLKGYGWGYGSGNRCPTRDFWCRERESNPYELTLTAP